MKKIISFLLIILIMTIAMESIDRQTIAANLNFHGEVRPLLTSKIPLKSTEQTLSNLTIKKLSSKNNTMQIEGRLEYGDKIIDFNKKGNLFKSKQVKSDYIIDFHEDRSIKNEDILLVHGEIRRKISENRLQVHKDLADKNILKLVFLDNDSQQILLFEIGLDDFDHNLFDSIDPDPLSTALTDTWMYKVVAPTVEISTDELGISPASAEAYEYINSSYTYDLGWTQTVHKIKLKSYACLQYPQSEFGVACGLRIVKEEVIPSDDSLDPETGWSNMEVGNYDDPVESDIVLYKNDNDYRDYVYQLQWDETGMTKQGSHSVSFGFSLSKGPLSGGYSTSTSYSASEATFVTVYEGDYNYPYYSNVKFENTKLTDEDNAYDLTYRCRYGRGGDDEKGIAVSFIIPFYESIAGIDSEYVETKVSTLSLEYYSN